MRKTIHLAVVIAVATLTGAGATAEVGQLATDPHAGTDVVVRDVAVPLAPHTITQSNDPDTLVDGASVACMSGSYTTENSWLRLFDLHDHGLADGQFWVESVDWGIQRVIGALDLTVSVYCLDKGLPFLYQFMVLTDSVVVPLTDQELTFHNTAIFGDCSVNTEDMAIELHAEDCNIAGCQECFIGMNDLGETAPTYVASASCGIPDPTDISGTSFPCCDLVMKVNGDHGIVCDDGGAPDDDGGDVPATTRGGAVLLLLILLGSGAYLLRRRAAT